MKEASPLSGSGSDRVILILSGIIIEFPNRIASPRRSVENMDVMPRIDSGSRFRTYDRSSGLISADIGSLRIEIKSYSIVPVVAD